MNGESNDPPYVAKGASRVLFARVLFVLRPTCHIKPLALASR